MNTLSIGDKAPDFSSVATNGKTLKSADFKGKYLVLYFYPKDNTPGCTIEANNFNSLKEKFAALNAEIVGVSKDSTASHDKFCTKYGLAFDLISDKDSDLCEKFGVWIQKSMFGKKYMGIERATFLIDPEGKIAQIWPKVSVIGHAMSVLKEIEKLKEL